MCAAATRSFKAKHDDIYASEASCRRYDVELCRKQDFADALMREFQTLAPWMSRATTRAADIGCGTGKIARILAPYCQSISSTDRSADCIAVARAAAASSSDDCEMSFEVADARQLPLANGSVNLVVAGWALSYLKSEHEEWYADGSYGGAWREEVDLALSELDRVLVDGGLVIVLETQGTATETPQREGSHFYAHLRQRGFAQKLVRTDYRFESKKEALKTLGFFFGKGVSKRAEALLGGVKDEGEPCIVPECTALFWRVKRRRGLLGALPGVLSSPRAVAAIVIACVAAAAIVAVKRR